MRYCERVRDKRPVLAIGTTVVRALEDAAEKGAGTNEPISSGRAASGNILVSGEAFSHRESIAYEFSFAEIYSLAMVAVFAGRENVLRAYRHAVEAGYRFYSYGDCMLIR